MYLIFTDPTCDDLPEVGATMNWARKRARKLAQIYGYAAIYRAEPEGGETKMAEYVGL